MIVNDSPDLGPMRCAGHEAKRGYHRGLGRAAGCATSPTSTPTLTAQQAFAQRVLTLIPGVVYTEETDRTASSVAPLATSSKQLSPIAAST
jgi:hypothetical protein